MKTALSDNALVQYTVLGCQMFTLSTAKALFYLLTASAVAVENPVEKSAIGLVIVPFWVSVIPVSLLLRISLHFVSNCEFLFMS